MPTQLTTITFEKREIQNLCIAEAKRLLGDKMPPGTSATVKILGANQAPHDEGTPLSMVVEYNGLSTK